MNRKVICGQLHTAPLHSVCLILQLYFQRKSLKKNESTGAIMAILRLKRYIFGDFQTV